MKIVVLVDSTAKNFQEIVNMVENKDVLIIDTCECNTISEYKHLADAIEEFTVSNNEILLGRISGKENVIRELGDERSEMILALSSNVNSQYYSGCPVEVFTNLINVFEKENSPIDVTEFRLNYIE